MLSPSNTNDSWPLVWPNSKETSVDVASVPLPTFQLALLVPVVLVEPLVVPDTARLPATVTLPDASTLNLLVPPSWASMKLSVPPDAWLKTTCVAVLVENDGVVSFEITKAGLVVVAVAVIVSLPDVDVFTSVRINFVESKASIVSAFMA